MSEAPRDPMRAAQANMRPAAIKRFYKTVEVREAAGRPLRVDARRSRRAHARPQPACGEEPGAHAEGRGRMGAAARDDRTGRHAADPAPQFGDRRGFAHDGRDARRHRSTMPAPISSATAPRSRRRWPNASGSPSIPSSPGRRRRSARASIWRRGRPCRAAAGVDRRDRAAIDGLSTIPLRSPRSAP